VIWLYETIRRFDYAKRRVKPKMTKRFLAVVFMLGLALALLLTGCSDSGPAVPAEEQTEPAEEGAVVEEEATDGDAGAATFTMEEIAQFDGKDGRPAYIVVDGVVYDVTNVRQWASGIHFGFEPGADVTEALAAAPHGANQLDNAEIVGTVVD
jgi:predicted heme/steroid binding protein